MDTASPVQGAQQGTSSACFPVLQCGFVILGIIAITKQLPVAELSGLCLFFFFFLKYLIRLDLFLMRLTTISIWLPSIHCCVQAAVAKASVFPQLPQPPTTVPPCGRWHLLLPSLLLIPPGSVLFACLTWCSSANDCTTSSFFSNHYHGCLLLIIQG